MKYLTEKQQETIVKSINQGIDFIGTAMCLFLETENDEECDYLIDTLSGLTELVKRVEGKQK